MLNVIGEIVDADPVRLTLLVALAAVLVSGFSLYVVTVALKRRGRW